MIAVVCLDDRGGMMFNHRRQSRDGKLIEYVLKMCRGKKLYMNEYSFPLFENVEKSGIIVDGDFLEKAQEGDFCFIEDRQILKFSEKIEKIAVFRWNRTYPRDLIFDIPLDCWNICFTDSFKGNSHEKIDVEVYVK